MYTLFCNHDHTLHATISYGNIPFLQAPVKHLSHTYFHHYMEAKTITNFLKEGIEFYLSLHLQFLAHDLA